VAKKEKQEIIPSVLNHGDSIETSVSHQLYIDGDQAWITYKVFTRVAEDEDSSQAHDRAMKHIEAGVKSLVTETVKNARKMSG
jgi:hypothetical protein